MVKAVAGLLLSVALAGCAAAPQARLATDSDFRPAHFAWDGAGEDPNQPKLASEPLRTTRAARSDRAQNVGEADEDAQLNRSLVICKGCLRQQPTEETKFARASD